MTDDIVIRVENLGKLYRIGEQEGYQTLRDRLSDALAAPFRLLAGRSNGHREAAHIWALRDVSFDVRRGEVVGIIGRNGAGKSTLLKILSRITEPTEGWAEIRGRIGSLLEVGTGFHPELTGRENIFLNGAILGMKKAEILRNFDAIVAFAEVEKFIDTPVKHYSSGMYLRLAFAVAAHLDTEILLVDEVLAVGDAQFQKKCLGKMGEVSQQGRTVIFISHNMSAVQRLCSRAILMADGKAVFDGGITDAVDRYLSDVLTAEYVGPPQNGTPTILRANIRWDEAEGIVLRVAFASPFNLVPPVLGFVLSDLAGTPVFGTNARFDGNSGQPAEMQAGEIQVRIDSASLRSDTYICSLWLGDQHRDYCSIEDALQVSVGRSLAEAHRPPRAVIGSTKLTTEWKYFDTTCTVRADSSACA